MIRYSRVASAFLASMALAAAAPGCSDDNDGNGGVGAGPNAVCEAPEEHPHDPSQPEWSYTGSDDGPEHWGDLPGYELCGTGNEQTPIDILTTNTMQITEPLVFEGYDTKIPLVELDNGHTLECLHEEQTSDPRITYAGKTYHLIQFHGHSTSEHLVDGQSFGYELHLVHQADDKSLAVVGILFELGPESELVATLLEHDPGHEKQTTCSLDIDLGSVIPSGGFYHYNGSLTTPACGEGVSWFVMKSHHTISAEQVAAYQEIFGGPTNRPVNPLGDRIVYASP